jgi:gliding motility-associated-like protein
MVMDEDASAFLYGTFLGGGMSATHVDGGTSRFDKRGIVYHAVCAGCGGISDFPSVNAPARHRQNRAANGARCNNAAFKFDLALLNASLRTNSVAFDTPGLDSLCFPSSIVFENLSSGAKYYEWDLGDGTIITTASTTPITHSYEKAGVYHVKLTAFNNETCEGTDIASTVVSVFDPDVEVVDDSSICYGSNFQLFATGGTTYFWESEDGTFTSFSSSPVVSPTDTTLYHVTITHSSGCQLTDSVLISVAPTVEYDFNVEKKYDCWNRPTAYFTYSTTADEDKYTFTWNFGDGTISNENPSKHDYDSDSTYLITLSVSDEFCTYQSSQELTVTTVKIPNVITPNGDDKNDKLIINEEEVELKVYNRWGKLLYGEENYQNIWPPDNLVSGIYYYYINIKNEATCKGWIHIIK